MASKGNSRLRPSGGDADGPLYSVQENTGGGSNVPAFLMKLWALVEDPSTDEIICWDQSGLTFHIFDQTRFAHEVLPFYFKHNNISSFIRQLNMYGFRKQTHVDQGGLKVERDDLEFGHAYFQRGQEQLLDMIKRKAAPVKIESRTMNLNTEELARVLSDVTQIQGKQENINSSLDQLRRENEALWREVASLRQKHSKQQQIVNKLIQFLLSLVGGRRGMPGLKRKMPLMISNAPATPDSDVSPAKVSRVASDGSVDHAYTVQSPVTLPEPKINMGTPSTSRLVIQELADPLDQTDSQKMAVNTSPVNQHLAITRNTPAPVSTVATGSSSQAGHSSATLDLLDQALASANILPESSVSNTGVPAGVALKSLLALPQQQVLPQQQATLQQQQLSKQQQQQKQQKQQPPKQPPTQQASTPSNQVVLRTQDKPLSSTSGLPSPKEVTEQLDIMQSDLDNLKELLSNGQYNIDSSFLLGLFDPEHTLPVNIDSTFLDGLAADTAETNEVPATGNITGNELLQYQPADNLPDLFDLGVTSPTTDEDDLPVHFEAGLHTPMSEHHTVSFSPGNTGTGLSINAEDLD